MNWDNLGFDVANVAPVCSHQKQRLTAFPFGDVCNTDKN